LVAVPLVLVPGAPRELSVVAVVVAAPWSLELVPLEPWFNPLEVPIELLPELEPEMLVPAEPEPVVVWPELTAEPDELDEPDEPAL
jgi:hypothetical protein